MKKLAFLFVATVAVVGFNVYAESRAIVSEEGVEVPNVGIDGQPNSLEPYMCMWVEAQKDCDEGSDNYCICEK